MSALVSIRPTNPDYSTTSSSQWYVKEMTQPYEFETFAVFSKLCEDCHIVLWDGIWNNRPSYSA